MRYITCLLAGLLLAGCATPTAEKAANWCERNGYARGTPEFLDCVERMVAADTRYRAATGGYGGGYSASQGLNDMGLTLMQMGAPRSEPSRLGPRIQPFTCRQMGGATHCF